MLTQCQIVEQVARAGLTLRRHRIQEASALDADAADAGMQRIQLHPQRLNLARARVILDLLAHQQ